jgi:hypothetical protein
MPAVVGFLIGFAILLSVLSYVAVEGFFTLSDYPVLKWCYLAFEPAYFCLFLFSLLGATKLPFCLGKSVSLVCGPYFMYFVNLLTCTALINIVRLINLGAKFSSDDPHEIRKWWLLGSHILIALMFLIGWINFQFPRIVDFDLASCQLQDQARELRILLATDLHLGYYCGKARLWKWVKLMNDQHADLIVLGGDVSDNFYEPIAHQRLHEELSLL